MESIIADIKNRMKGEADLSKKDVMELVDLFKERHISIMALETLLNFYQKPEHTTQDIQKEAFLSPSDVIKTSNDILKQDNARLKYELNLAIKAKDELGVCLKQKEKLVKWLMYALIFITLAAVIAWIY